MVLAKERRQPGTHSAVLYRWCKHTEEAGPIRSRLSTEAHGMRPGPKSPGQALPRMAELPSHRGNPRCHFLQPLENRSLLFPSPECFMDDLKRKQLMPTLKVSNAILIA